MKRVKFLLIIVLISIAGISNAQQIHHNKGDRDKIKAERVAFMSSELDLSVEEAQNFWPIYNEFEKQNEELFNEERNIMRELKTSLDKLSDSEIEKKLIRVDEIQVEKAQLQIQYFDKFKKVLPVKKLAKLQANEREFRRQLLHNYGKCYGKEDK